MSAWQLREVRKFRWAVVALVAAAGLAVATPIVQSANVRYGIVRSVKRVMIGHERVPASDAKLPVVFDAQDRALSCEAATLKMALAYRGTAVTEDDLVERIGFDPTPRSVVRGGKDMGVIVWGDPDEAFVGNIDGVMGKTGYGVHARPIARAAGAYRRVAVIERGTPEVLARAIADGNPVIVWGFIGRGRPLAWQTLAGKTVRAVNGEHTRIAMGYTGTADAPTGFFLMDPIYGEQYVALDDFLKNWDALGRQGVVVY